MATRRTKPPQVPPRDPSALIPGGVPPDDFRLPINGATGEVIEFEVEPPPETAADRIAAMMLNAGSVDRATVKLYKVLDPATKKLGACRDYTPEEFEAGGVDMIRKHWGPGDFVAYLYGEQDGQYSRRGAMTLAVLEDRSASASNAPAGDPTLSRVLESIAMQQQRMLEALTQRPDPTAQMRDTLALMATMREAMGLNSNSQPAPSISQVLEDLRKMQKAAQEFGKDPDAKSDKDDLLTILAPLVPKLAEAIGNRAPHGVVNEPYVPPVMLPASFAQAPATAAAPVAEGDGAATVPAEGSAAPAHAPTPEEIEQHEVMQMYGALMFYYNGLAKRDHDPEAAAETMYAQLPDDALMVLHTDGWWDAFVKFNPGGTAYREWYTKVRDQVLKLAAEDAKDAAG